eukprot:GILK01006077.1.p1 GENE.GILK01006077.1~~GILK01006077.1.p1  ORF type:complete len:572 (-),score=80.46 GILK01006077.1:205-1878(-)
MTATFPRVVPWQSWSEWTQVHQWLLGPYSDTNTKQLGLSRIAAWRSRGKVPLSVDVTAMLVQTMLSDRRFQLDGQRSEVDLRLSYSMILLRMVNGIVDQVQKGTHAQSISSLAQQLQLPSWLVDLRHEATHNQLPALPMLQFGAQQALQWLSINYWDKQWTHLSSTGARIKECIHGYREAQTLWVKLDKEKLAVDQASGLTTKVLRKRTKKALLQLVATTSPDALKSMLIPLLLEPGYMLPPTVSKAKSNTASVKAKFNRVVTIWGPAIDKLRSSWPEIGAILLQHIVSLLFSDSTSESALSSVSTEVLLKWIAWIVAPERINSLKSTQHTLFPLLKQCIEEPQPIGIQLLPLLTPIFDSEYQTRIDQAITLMRLHSNFPTNKPRVTDSVTVTAEPVPTLDFFQTFSQRLTEQRDSIDQKENKPQCQLLPSTWTLVDNWKACPIGSLPQTATTSLELPEFLDAPCANRLISVEAFPADPWVQSSATYMGPLQGLDEFNGSSANGVGQAHSGDDSMQVDSVDESMFESFEAPVTLTWETAGTTVAAVTEWQQAIRVPL